MNVLSGLLIELDEKENLKNLHVNTDILVRQG